MKRRALLIFILLVMATGASRAQKPTPADMPRWTYNTGKWFRANFVSMSGDVIVFELNGREFRRSAGMFKPESAARARKLGGIQELPRPKNAEKPKPRMDYILIGPSGAGPSDLADRLRNQNTLKDPLVIRFKMGSPEKEAGRGANEPLHNVSLSHSFYMKATEVTWDEWNWVRSQPGGLDYSDLFVDPRPNSGDRGSHPVVGISWWDAIKWCNLLSKLENLSPVYHTKPTFETEFLLKTGKTPVFANWEANGYRLPTEAEWEYACTANPVKPAAGADPARKGNNRASLDSAAWYQKNSANSTHPVAGKVRRRFGLFDMLGNAAEWCWDADTILGPSDANDPRGAASVDRKIIRGGAWCDPANACRPAARAGATPDFKPNNFVGFRPVRNQ